MYKSSKLFNGYSTVFRQWKAEDTHCKFLHGYGISFRVWFEGELDERNWVWDFGGMKRAKTPIDDKNPKEWLDYMFDHTVIIANDDPEIDTFVAMDKLGVIQLRTMPATGAEAFAKYLYIRLNNMVRLETNGRVSITKVEFYENERNSASYEP